VITLLLALSPAAALATTVGPVTELTATPSGFSERAPAIAWDGSEYVLVWEDGRALAERGVDVYVARISPAGALIDASGILMLLLLLARATSDRRARGG
jgi:hypothetical protein